MGRNSESADGKRLLDPNGPRLVFGVLCKPFKGMAGTTRLELATSAVTVRGLQVLSTTWKSTDGTASHWKYIIDNANVYREVYCADLGESREDRELVPSCPLFRSSELSARVALSALCWPSISPFQDGVESRTKGLAP